MCQLLHFNIKKVKKWFFSKVWKVVSADFIRKHQPAIKGEW